LIMCSLDIFDCQQNSGIAADVGNKIE